MMLISLPSYLISLTVNISEGEAWEDITSQTNGITMGNYGTLTIPNAQNTSAGRYSCTAKSMNPTTKSEVIISQVSNTRTSHTHSPHFLSRVRRGKKEER